MKGRALRRSHTSSASPRSPASPSPSNLSTPTNSSLSAASSSSSSSSTSSWVHLRSILFVVASSSPANCSDQTHNKSPWSHRRRKRTISSLQWRNLFTPEGKLRDGGVRLVKKVRSGGVHPSIRAEVWPFLLGVYELNSTKEERDIVRDQNRKIYENLRKQCRDSMNHEQDSPSSEDAISAEASPSREERCSGTDCSVDPSSALLETYACSGRVANADADAADLNSESSDSDSSEDSVIIHDWPQLEGIQRNDVDVSSKENACPSATEIQSKPCINGGTNMDKLSKEITCTSRSEVPSRLGINEGNNVKLLSGTEVQSKPCTAEMDKLSKENISNSRTKVQSRLGITGGNNDEISSGQDQSKPYTTGANNLNKLSKEHIYTSRTKIRSRLGITKENNDEVPSGTDLNSNPCSTGGNIMDDLSKEYISTSRTEVQSRLCITEASDDEILSGIDIDGKPCINGGTNIDKLSKENTCTSRSEVRLRLGINEGINDDFLSGTEVQSIPCTAGGNNMDKLSKENVPNSSTKVRSRLGITEGNNDEMPSGQEVQLKPYTIGENNLNKLSKENISTSRTKIRSRLGISKEKTVEIHSGTEFKSKSYSTGGSIMDKLSKEIISTSRTEVQAKRCITERSNDEIPSGTNVDSESCINGGNIVDRLSKEKIATSGTEAQSRLHTTETEENNDEIPSKDNASPCGTNNQSEFCNTENFTTWQRIIRVDAVRVNPEWIPYSPYQATISDSQARRSAKAVGLKDYDHLDSTMIFHAARLVAILEAYALYDPEIGYCQGMCDLLSPIISVITEDHEAFWCFVGFMRKARHNFRLDEVGIQRQLNIVSKIIKSKDSHLYRHLENLQAEDCSFVYRMVVVLFRRELTFEQTLCLWEVMWADQAALRAGIGKSAWSKIRQRAPPTDDLLLYAIAASVLQRRKLIIEKYSSMDEILRECNNMEGQLDVWKLLDDAHHLVVTLQDKI